MLLNRADGSINTFLSITTVQTYSTSPQFTTSSAFYFEEKDPNDGFGYFYVAFTMSKVMQIVKFKNINGYPVSWTQ